MKKFSPQFERDFKWYLSMRHNFNFDGSAEYFKQTVQIFRRPTGTIEYTLLNEVPFTTFKQQFPQLVSGNAVKAYSDGMFYEYAFMPAAYPLIVYDAKGASGKEAFYAWDSTGEVLPTRHPNLLHSLLKTKGSVNLHVKMYAQSRADGTLPLMEFSVRQAVKAYGAFKVLREALTLKL